MSFLEIKIGSTLGVEGVIGKRCVSGGHFSSVIHFLVK
jgi:hypothetical protein